MAMVYLHFLTTAAGVSPIEAPNSTNSLHLESVLFQTVTLKPLLIKFMDMAFPIIPSPKKPTSIFFFPTFFLSAGTSFLSPLSG
uniref:Glyoxylate/succinic semialdehyde reductase 1-like n=1 Tax=Rhizophora mucronata TaxID=61149 RepID=A0A2P2MIA7_RHIMU